MFSICVCPLGCLDLSSKPSIKGPPVFARHFLLILANRLLFHANRLFFPANPFCATGRLASSDAPSSLVRLTRTLA
jgi:hypothetical protein